MALLEMTKRADSKYQDAVHAQPIGHEEDFWDAVIGELSGTLNGVTSALFSSFGGTSSSETSFSESSKQKSETHKSKGPEGIYGVTYQRYPITGYVELPSVLQPFVQIPGLDHILMIGRPTADVSGGMKHYRDVCPKSLRAAAPFLLVLDRPDAELDPKYKWVELPLSDVFKLDVRPFKKMDDYVKTLSKKGRWNFKDRQKKFHNPKVLTCEYVDLPLGSEEQVAELWPLYKQTGEANGFCVLSEKEFRKFHLRTPGLKVMCIRDVAQNNQLVTFCTGVRVDDTVMPMWCGTDYENPLARSCATYFNMLYEYVRLAIADPEISWVDLGASRRQAKTSIGFNGYPVTAYIRCKNSITQSVVHSMAEQYFKPTDLITDP